MEGSALPLKEELHLLEKHLTAQLELEKVGGIADDDVSLLRAKGELQVQPPGLGLVGPPSWSP